MINIRFRSPIGKKSMRPAYLVLFVLSVLSASIAHGAGEETVTFTSNGQAVVGTLARPSDDPAPVVLLLHGFTGSRDELKTEHVAEGVFARTAARLAEQGYASLRIDFRGSGDSTDDLTFAQTTFEGQAMDALAAIEYLESSDQVQGDEIYLIGWSQGGLVASAVAGRSSDLDAVALWNAVEDPEEAFTNIFGADVLQMGMAAASDEAIAVTLPWGPEIELNGAFFDGIENFDASAEISAYAGPLLVVQGEQDTTVLPASADRFIEAHEGPEKLWKADMDHVFNTFATDETLEQMIEATIAFFKAHDD